MYWSSVIEYLVEQRLAEARAGAAQRALLRSLRPARRPSRAGRWLMAALRAVVATLRGRVTIERGSPPSPVRGTALSARSDAGRRAA